MHSCVRCLLAVKRPPGRGGDAGKVILKHKTHRADGPELHGKLMQDGALAGRRSASGVFAALEDRRVQRCLFASL